MLRLHGDPGALDLLTDFAATCVQPAVEALEGSIGLSLWLDRAAGDAILATVWTSQAAMAASESTEEPLRARAAELTGSAADVERFEGVLVDALRPVQAGNVMRLVQMQALPGDIDDHVEWSRAEVMPVLHRTPGYLAYFCGVDRARGRAVSMSTYCDRTDADIALMTTSTLRSAAADRGISVDVMRDYDVAIAGIRISLPPLPTQRAAAADRDEAMYTSPAGG